MMLLYISSLVADWFYGGFTGCDRHQCSLCSIAFAARGFIPSVTSVCSGLFTINLSVSVLIEYEAVLKRDASRLDLAEADIDALLDYICQIADLHEVHFSWRPTLRDPGDEMILELAVAAGCDAIVTFNKRDFTGVAQFGLRLLTPQELLQEIGVIG
ncbi:MAG: PIN domain-containing protein [Caldilineaceae bacterium]